ncbi:MAG: hypothetical protein V9G04_05270 [Nocardioides sp.]
MGAHFDAAFIAGLAAALGAALVYGIGAIVQARAVRTLPSGTDDLVAFVRDGVRQPLIWLTLAMYGLGFALHAVSIWLLPLYLSQAGIAMSLPVTALCAGLISERVATGQWGALLLVVGGIAMLSLGAGSAGSTDMSWSYGAACLAGSVLLGILTLSGVVKSGAGLGLLAGLGYAGVAIAVRGLEAWPLDAGGYLAAIAAVLFGVFAFWAYSRGLDNADVSVSTATMVVGETVGPALVGVLWLGDGIRDGWTPWVVIGLIVAMLGSITVGHGAEERASESAIA